MGNQGIFQLHGDSPDEIIFLAWQCNIQGQNENSLPYLKIFLFLYPGKLFEFFSVYSKRDDIDLSDIAEGSKTIESMTVRNEEGIVHAVCPDSPVCPGSGIYYALDRIEKNTVEI